MSLSVDGISLISHKPLNTGKDWSGAGAVVKWGEEGKKEC